MAARAGARGICRSYEQRIHIGGRRKRKDQTTGARGEHQWDVARRKSIRGKG